MSEGNTNSLCSIFGTLEPEVRKESAAVVQVTRTAVAEQALFRNGSAAGGAQNGSFCSSFMAYCF